MGIGGNEPDKEDADEGWTVAVAVDVITHLFLAVEPLSSITTSAQLLYTSPTAG
jgi:hypothetical protein